MDIEQGLTDQRLFARWAGEDFPSWERAVGATVTHLSRGKGTVTGVSRETGTIAVHVAYERSQYAHATWELRTEFTRMTLPEGLTRAEITPGARAWRLQEAERAQEDRQVVASKWRGFVT